MDILVKSDSNSGQRKLYSDSLRSGRSGIESRWGAEFSAPVQTGSGAHPASCTMGTGSFPGVKRPGRGVDHPPPSSADVKERIELYLYTTSGPSWPVIGLTLSYFYLYLYDNCERNVLQPIESSALVHRSSWSHLRTQTLKSTQKIITAPKLHWARTLL